MIDCDRTLKSLLTQKDTALTARISQLIIVLESGAGASSCPLGETGSGCRPAVSFFQGEAKQFNYTGLPPSHKGSGLPGSRSPEKIKKMRVG